MPRILIVEDNKDIATLYERALFSHESKIVTTAEIAIETINKEHFDLVILDMHLPADSGMSVLRYIRSNKINTKVFVISADDLLRQECRELGIEGWMTKPIELDELMVKVARLLT